MVVEVKARRRGHSLAHVKDAYAHARRITDIVPAKDLDFFRLQIFDLEFLLPMSEGKGSDQEASERTE